VYYKGVVIVKCEGAFLGVVAYGASHCKQWGHCVALFSNLFEDLLLNVYRPTEYRMKEVENN